MLISNHALDSIQTAGAATFAAHAELQSTVGAFSEQVKAAVLNNAFDMGNDSLFEEWKSLARLTQALAQIEAELRNVYATASAFSSVKGAALPALSLLSPPQLTNDAALHVVTAINATDVRIKKSLTTATMKPGNSDASKSVPLRGNTAKLFAQLLQMLNQSDFVKINQSALATEIGIPKGSIGASIAKLLRNGQLVRDPKGQLKLA